MNTWAKMMMALRSGVNETGEAFTDSEALRILDQQVRGASEKLKQCKERLADIMSRQKLAEQQANSLTSQIKEHEKYALKAMEKGDEPLVREVAKKIAELENRQEIEKESARNYTSHLDGLRDAIRQAENNIKLLKQQADTVKATENVQRAQTAVAERDSGPKLKLRTAIDSFKHIKEKKKKEKEQVKTVTELMQASDEDALQVKLKKAGIAHSSKSVEDILERLKTGNKGM